MDNNTERSSLFGKFDSQFQSTSVFVGLNKFKHVQMVKYQVPVATVCVTRAIIDCDQYTPLSCRIFKNFEKGHNSETAGRCLTQFGLHLHSHKVLCVASFM